MMVHALNNRMSCFKFQWPMPFFKMIKTNFQKFRLEVGTQGMEILINVLRTDT